MRIWTLRSCARGPASAGAADGALRRAALRGVWPWLLWCGLLCAVWCNAWPAAAQTHSEQSSAEQLLTQAKTALERARFDDAEKLLSQLSARPELSARERNETLELSAIVAIAARKENRAKDTLRTLLHRDPAHTRRITDLGPSVDAAFARAQQAREAPIEVPLTSRLTRDPDQRSMLHVRLGDGRDAVQTVHVFVDTLDGGPSVHMVSPALGTEELTFLLPPPLAERKALHLYLEAQAPSGTVIGHQADAASPLLARLPAAPPAPRPACTAQPKPLRREWWVWTSVALVVSSVVVAAAVTVQ